MRRSTRLFVAAPLVVLCVSACSKDPAPQPTASPSSVPSEPLGPLAETAASAASSATSAPAPSAAEPPAPAVPTACPSTENWSTLSGFATACGYKWTRTPADLPKPPEWIACSVENGDPSASCKRLARSGNVDGFAAGTNSAGKTQIGFVERCAAPQIVIADVDGPTRFALRATQHSGAPSACALALIDVDMGRWVGALGGSEESNDPEYGMCVGNAYAGGLVGVAPTIMQFQTKQLFDIRSSGGSITSEGWFADGKSRRWNNKEFEKMEPFDWAYVTEKVLGTERRGIFAKTESAPASILLPQDGRTFGSFRRRDKAMAWIESTKDESSCWLVAGELNKSEMLEKARRITKISCNAKRFEIGCDAAMLSGDDGVSWISLKDGTSRQLDLKASLMAFDCKEAYFRHADHLLRFEISAFGEPKPAPEPMVELPLTLPVIDADAGTSDASAPDAAPAAPATSSSK